MGLEAAVWFAGRPVCSFSFHREQGPPRAGIVSVYGAQPGLSQEPIQVFLRANTKSDQSSCTQTAYLSHGRLIKSSLFFLFLKH